MINKEEDMQCHKCGADVVKQWIRGELIFCSDKCRTESWNEGEPLEEKYADRQVRVEEKVKDEP